MGNQEKNYSRRKFIQTTATAAIAAPFVFNSCQTEPSGFLNMACIGIGGMGLHDLKQYIEHPYVNIKAICDVDSERLKHASELLPQAKTYTDWRKLLENEKNHIEALSITVPDHNHYAIAYSAIDLGKHVYLQKPDVSSLLHGDVVFLLVLLILHD